MGFNTKPIFHLENGQVISDDGEFDAVRPWCKGAGLNLGCGIRQPHRNLYRVSLGDDHNGYDSPDAVVNFNETLPWVGERFDFVLMSHSLEHAKDIYFTLREARRVAINHVVIVWPDRRWTGFDSDHILLTGTQLLAHVIRCGFEIVFAGETQPNWSYGVVYK